MIKETLTVPRCGLHSMSILCCGCTTKDLVELRPMSEAMKEQGRWINRLLRCNELLNEDVKRLISENKELKSE